MTRRLIALALVVALWSAKRAAAAPQARHARRPGGDSCPPARGRAMRLGSTLALAIHLALAHAVPAAALSCVFHPFQAEGARFGTRELVAHVEVLEVRANRIMDVRVLRVLHGREQRPVVAVDTAWALGWNMPQQWGFKPFSRGTQWVIVMLPGDDGRAPWQPQLCRAFLKVEGDSAVGFVADLTKRERLPLDVLAGRAAAPQAPARPTTSR